MKCSGCGDTRDDEVSFYLPEGEPEVTDEQLIARAQTGPEKLCEFCDSSNPADAEECQNCKAPLTARSREESFEPAAKTEVPPVPQPEVESFVSSQSEPPSRPSKFKACGCLSIIALIIFGFIAGRFIQREQTLTVIGASWERSFDAERFVTVSKTGWQGELPSGARITSSRRAVRGHRQVQIGTENVIENEQYQEQIGTEKVKIGTKDLGNGFFEDVYEDRPVYETRTRQKSVAKPVFREEAIYGTEVSYNIDEWQVSRRAEARSTDLVVQWPKLLNGEREKANTRAEKYNVKLRSSKGKVYPKDVSDVMFQLYRLGSQHTAKIDSFGTIRTIRPKS